MIARLARRTELVARVKTSARRSAAQLCGGGDAAQDEERHCQVLRCSGRNRGTRWVDDDDLWFASLPPHIWGPRPFRQTPFCQTVRTVSQTGSVHPGLKSVPCKNLRTAGCSKNESFWRSRRWTHIPTKLHRGRLSPAVCKGAVGSNCPHGTPKAEKKRS